jgi:membrane protein
MRTIVRSVDLDVPPRTAAACWTHIESFPQFMGAVRDVRRLDERSSHWVVIVAHERREFGAVVTEVVPDARIAWESRGPTRHHGAVSFLPLDGGRTRVTVELNWEPEGLFDRVGDRLGLVRRQVGRDLDAFRRYVLSGADRGQLPVESEGADDRGRGGEADGPAQIPLRGWVDVVKRTVAELRADNISVVAAGVAFYVFLALVPALVAVVSVYGLAADPADVRDQLASYLSALPTDARRLVLGQIRDITGQGEAGLGIGLAFSVAAALFSASKGVVSLISALNIAYDEQETRTLLRLRALALVVTLAMTVVAAAAVGGMVAVANVAERFGSAGEVTLTILRWLGLGALVVLGLGALYRYAPDRPDAPWRRVTPGAVVATMLWLIGSILFSIYASAFGDFQRTYGSLYAVAALLLWLFLSAYVIVLGAELDAEAERQPVSDSPVGST